MQRINVTIKIDDEISEDEGSCIVCRRMDWIDYDRGEKFLLH